MTPLIGTPLKLAAEMVADCPECGETMTEGWLYRGGVVYTHLRDCLVLGERLAEESRRTRELQRAELRKQRSNLPSGGHASIAEYRRAFPQVANTRSGIALCERFVQACAKAVPECGLTLRGYQGTGKTTLIVAFSRSLLTAGVDVRFERTPELYNRLLQASRNERLDTELQRLKHATVLILDDLGREKPTPWWVDQVLFPLVDYRYGHGKPTVTTTNYDWPALESLYDHARNEREQAHSAPQLIDRLQHRSAAVSFGGADSLRTPEWDFAPKKGAA